MASNWNRDLLEPLQAAVADLNRGKPTQEELLAAARAEGAAAEREGLRAELTEALDDEMNPYRSTGAAPLPEEVAWEEGFNQARSVIFEVFRGK